MPDYIYVGKREPNDPGSARVQVYKIGYSGGSLVPYHLDPCNRLYDHSPDGFNWGYGGSGPAQLGLALAFHAMLTDDSSPSESWCKKVAVRVHQFVKEKLVAGIKEDRWYLTSREVREVIAAASVEPHISDLLKYDAQLEEFQTALGEGMPEGEPG